MGEAIIARRGGSGEVIVEFDNFIPSNISSELIHSAPTALSVARYSLAGASVGNYALFTGGEYGSDSYSSTVDAYNASLTRSTPTALSVARSGIAGASVGNHALFAGGYDGSDYYNTVNAYTPSVPEVRLYMPIGTKYKFGESEETATTNEITVLAPLTGYIKYKRGVVGT
jgi:hypothetical protein